VARPAALVLVSRQLARAGRLASASTATTPTA
jgi:hypothetical protein